MPSRYLAGTALRYIIIIVVMQLVPTIPVSAHTCTGALMLAHRLPWLISMLPAMVTSSFTGANNNALLTGRGRTLHP